MFAGAGYALTVIGVARFAGGPDTRERSWHGSGFRTGAAMTHVPIARFRTPERPVNRPGACPNFPISVFAIFNPYNTVNDAQYGSDDQCDYRYRVPTVAWSLFSRGFVSID